MVATARSVNPPLFLHQAIEDFKQGIYDGLAKGVGRCGNFVFAVVTRGDGEIAAFVSNNRLSPFNCPKGEIAAAGNRYRLALLVHGVHLPSGRTTGRLFR